MNLHRCSFATISFLIVVFCQPVFAATPASTIGGMTDIWKTGNTEIDIVYKNYLLQSELVTQERTINTAEALHVFGATEAQAEHRLALRPDDPQKRSEFQQAIGQAVSVMNQSISQANQTEMQKSNDNWSKYNQQRQEIAARSNNDINQTISLFNTVFSQTKGSVSAGLTGADFNFAYPCNALAEEAFTKQVNTGRQSFRTAMDLANSKWATAYDKSKTDAHAMDKANRVWKNDAYDALDDLRASFNSAIRKYRSALGY